MTLISPTEQILRDLLTRRILILDGAMGTMIQQYKLTESDYRGGENGRFKDFTGPAGAKYCNKGKTCGCGAIHEPAPENASTRTRIQVKLPVTVAG